MATYVDLSNANGGSGICITHSYSNAVIQYDFSGYSSYFTNVPELLNILIAPYTTVDPYTYMDTGQLIILDDDPNTSNTYSFSYSFQLENPTSNPMNIPGPELTFNAKPYDFDAVTNFNIWISPATPGGAGVTVNQVLICVIGFWY
jgi:hypothetical protein